MTPSTQARIDDVIAAVKRHATLTPIGERVIRNQVRLALKEQDRDARHACAEAVLTISSDGRLIECERRTLASAHQACMNARAI